MKKFVLNFICCCVPWGRVRHKIRSLGARVAYKNNIIEIVDENGLRIPVKKVPGCEFRFSGGDNHIVLHEPLKNLKLKVCVSSGVFIEIFGSDGWSRKISVFKEAGNNNVNKLIIGKGFTSTNFVHFDFCQGEGDIIIGDDCMFSWGVQVRTGDFHSIYSLDTRELLNPNKDVKIGNHVWVGAEVRILKGAIIPDNTVVGTQSIVTRQFKDSNVVIAGVPAGIVRNDIGWSRVRPADYSF